MKILIIILICGLLILSGCNINRCVYDCRQCFKDQFCINNSDTNYHSCYQQKAKVCLDYGFKQKEGVK